MGTTTGVGFVPAPTQVEEYTHRLTGSQDRYSLHTHTHTLDVRSSERNLPPGPIQATGYLHQQSTSQQH